MRTHGLTGQGTDGYHGLDMCRWVPHVGHIQVGAVGRACTDGRHGSDMYKWAGYRICVYRWAR